ncbi:MAG: RNA 2',3'-cyclic phosphodiesterase [Candidatus Omnitrophota bacterium]|nr:RNA 2',3'-cyclic phosphodiesterase [Candidatus Omnitrophota bacterium]
MRAFIAIELSEEIRSSLSQIQSHLKYSGADVKWVEKDNIHLTLKFLGEITEEKCEKIKSILDEIGRSLRPFEINIKNIGAFPKIDHPRVIWVGLDKGAKESVEVAGKIDEELYKIGFEKESRPFTAHLTIGRVRSSKNKDALKQKLTAYSLQLTAETQLISSVIFFQSKLSPKGSIYTKLYEAKFQR